MSSLAAALPAGNPLNPSEKLVVSNRLLFLTYLPMLLVYPLVLADQLLWNGALRALLPSYPEKLLWWLFIFNFPHIVGGHLSYADPDYLRHYKAPLLRSLVVATIITVAIPATLGVMPMFVVGFAYTMYHVLMQQFGLSLMLMGQRPDWAFQGWRWLSIAGATVFYALLYAGPGMSAETLQGYTFLARLLMVFSLPFALVLWVRGWRRRREKPVGLAYFSLNLVMLFGAWGLFELGYPFFVNAIPRIAHDFTAFVVYAVHDSNRHRDGQPNWIYRNLQKVGIGPALGCVLVAAGIAGVFTAGMKLWFPLIYPIIFVSIIHYYMEGYIWKRGSLHRQYTPFAGA